MKSSVQIIEMTNSGGRTGPLFYDTYFSCTILPYDAKSQRQEIHFSGLALVFPFG